MNKSERDLLLATATALISVIVPELPEDKRVLAQAIFTHKLNAFLDGLDATEEKPDGAR
jgi:hypothetical protein